MVLPLKPYDQVAKEQSLLMTQDSASHGYNDDDDDSLSTSA